MLKSLPPAGNPILLTAVEAPEKVFKKAFGDRSVFLYGSGTMALAAALMAAKDLAKARHGITSPEVLLPAYACPDLLSAALYAGLKPILVDLQGETPWMDLDELQARLSPNTVAVIAAHFLGIPERLASIRAVLEGSTALLVEDSAQLFPSKPVDGVWEGDLVVLSFGRGKPVSLLGGGAVLCRTAALMEHLPLANKAALPILLENLGVPGMLYKFKAHLYNRLLSPTVYGVLQYIPFLNLGETVFKPLQGILPFAKERVGLLAANIAAYETRERKQQERLMTMLADVTDNAISDLTSIRPNQPELTLLRYPVLVQSQRLRDHLLSDLTHAGLGCSRMYPRPLPEIDGIDGRFQGQGEFPQAALFSQRLLTLPCHAAVTSSDIEAMRQVIEARLFNER